MSTFGRAYDIVVSANTLYLPLYESNMVVAIGLDEDNYMADFMRWGVPTPHGLNIVNGKITSANYHDRSISIIGDGEMVRQEVPCEPVSVCDYNGRILLADYLNNRVIYDNGEVFCNVPSPHSVSRTGDVVYVASRGVGVYSYRGNKQPGIVPSPDPLHARYFDGLYIADYKRGLVDPNGSVRLGGPITGMWVHDGTIFASSEAGGNPHLLKVLK